MCVEDDGTRTAATDQPAAEERPSAEGGGFLKVLIGGLVTILQEVFSSRICTDDADRE